MATIKDVVKVLSECLDPELGASVVDLGLVYDIKIGGGKDITVKMTMTSPMCPIMGMILADAKSRLESLKTGGKVDVQLVWNPPWTPEMMSESLRNRF